MAAVTSAATAAVARIGAALSDAQYFESTMVRVEDIRRQLDSRSTKDKLDAMKRVIALISLGKDASTFFPDVVKNVVATSLDVKKLVYVYLVHYAEHKQDLALLAINSFQKDLSDPNQHIRALSLRVLSSIRVKVILQVVILAINNAAKDASPYVRKAAAHAISKVCALDVASRELLIEPLQHLISDRSSQVMGSAVAAFDDVCPYNWELIHPQYRRICNSLSSIDPWGQISIIQMLLRYARMHFSRPHPRDTSSRHADLTLLLKSVSPLFDSLNHSVVASAIAVFFHLATDDEFCNVAVKPLMRLVAIQDDGGQAASLHIAAAVAVRFPSVIIPYVSEFYVSPVHSAPIRNLRMKVLMTVCAVAGHEGGIGSRPEARRALLAELKDYLFRQDMPLAAAAARAIGCLATAHPGSTPVTVRVLSSVVTSTDNPVVVSESIAVLRRLLQRHPAAQSRALPQLVAMLLSDDGKDSTSSIRDPSARASIIWLIGEFFEKVQPVATEALRLLARGFAKEEPEVKLQILNLAAKVAVWSGSDEQSDVLMSGLAPPESRTSLIRKRLLEYVISCARYDRDYDVRDKARMLNSLFMKDSDPVLFEAARRALLSRKPIPSSSEPSAEEFVSDGLDPDVVIGSMAHVLTGRRLFGFRPLELWAELDSGEELRQDDTGSSSVATPGERDYTAMSSADFPVAISSANMSAVFTGLGPQSVSSSSADIGPGAVSGMSNTAASSLMYTNSASSIGRSGLGKPNKIVHVDPESFYKDAGGADDDSGDDDEDGVDEDDDDEDDDDEYEEPIRPANPLASTGTAVAAAYARKAGYTAPLHAAKQDLLIGPSLGDATTGNGTTNTAAPTRKATSEYDLDALFGSLDVQSTTTPPKLTTVPLSPFMNADSRDRSEWTSVLEAWNSGGLETQVAYLRNEAPGKPDVTPLVLRITNRGKVDLTDISLVSKCGDCFSAHKRINKLPPAESAEVGADARFRGKTAGVRFSIRVGENVAGEGEFKPSIGYVIRPRPGISPGDFQEAEKNLTGMFATEATVKLPRPTHNDWMSLAASIKDQILNGCFVSHIKTSVGASGGEASQRFSTVFAGYLPSDVVAQMEQRPLLIRITVLDTESDTNCSCTIWIGCEQVLFSANLLNLCRSALLSIGSRP